MGSYPAVAIDLSFLPDLETGSNQSTRFLQPESYPTLLVTADVHGTTTDLHGTTKDPHGTATGLYTTTGLHHLTTNLDDGFFRGLAMVLNPMDGVLDWDG